MQNESCQFESDKDHGKRRRGKRPDIQVYVPRARLGQRERRSEEKESSPSLPVETQVYDSGGKENRDWDADNPESEIVISGSPDLQRKVHVQSKGRAMKVTVLKDSLSSPTSPKSQDFENPVSKDNKQFSAGQKSWQQAKDAGRVEQARDRQGQQNDGLKSVHHTKDTGKAESTKDRREQTNESGRRGNGIDVEKEYKQNCNESAKEKEFCVDRGGGDVTGLKSSETGKVGPERADTGGRKSYRRNRRSNSNDSRPSKTEHLGKESEQVISRTFPRSKGASSKSAAGQQDSGDSERSRRDTTGKGNGRDNERFYWGMRRQRTGSISSEASVASNNGSFYSGSSDFTEDDEPEHILDWGAESEKAHLEEVARLVNDGAQRLTSSLDAYPDGGPPSKVGDIAVPPGLDRQKSISSSQPIGDTARPPGRRNRRKKNSSRQGSRDSSVHSSIHGDDSASERGQRRRRHRRGSKDSQGHYRDQHQGHAENNSQYQQKHRHGQQTSAGEGGRGHRSGLQVTVGQNNRHVAISPQAGASGGSSRQRHLSNEALEPYTVDSAGEDWDKEIQNNMARSWRDDDGRWPDDYYDSKKSPRFERKGVDGGGRGRQRRDSGRGRSSHDDGPQHQRDRKERQRLKSGDFADDPKRFENFGPSERSRYHEDHRGSQPQDQRLVHPAYDASAGQNPRGRGRGQGQRQGAGHRGWDNQKVGGRAMSEDCDDRTASQARERGLLRMPTPAQQQEPPRPSSTPSAAERQLAQQHLQYRLDGDEGSTGNNRGSNTRGPIHGTKQLFDPKNPSKPIVISEGNPAPLQFEGEENQASPASGSGFGPPSPESQTGSHPQPPYPHPMYPPDYPSMYGYRPRMPPFMPPAPYMRGFPPGSMPPHPAFFGYPQMPPVVPPYYNR